MKENFEKSLELVLAHEGGYVHHALDPGGRTNLGVTQRVWEDSGLDTKLTKPKCVASQRDGFATLPVENIGMLSTAINCLAVLIILPLILLSMLVRSVASKLFNVP
jgi:hypothetical protein